MLLLLASGPATPPPVSTTLVAPTGLSVYRYGPKYVELVWSAVTRTTEAGVASYRLYINGTWDGQNIPAVWSSSTMNSDKLTLTPNTAYSFHVRAVDSLGGETGPSNTVTITTPKNQDVGKFKRRRYAYDA